ncbi:hypothetical protein CR205_10575 [Alteribacter lacisalsi]|uniref:AbrB/MazE/SpoVT family DNA-binding domain-containing protein n=1 Tax=Alteribacter lacisalsi TaxID=2045244 RepID=A0A2W0HAU6_9BACI|nr:hypothetical protein [Alteribacter lacisalsi]PYZ98983.1 hypothetical protein CR205_10575 [Alteribacter lacisalsi]
MRESKREEYRILTKLRNGQIAIPGIIRDLIPLQKSSEVTVAIRPGTNQITIRRYEEPNQENRVVINSRGALWLPVEIKNILDINEEDLFAVNVNHREREIVLSLLDD